MKPFSLTLIGLVLIFIPQVSSAQQDVSYVDQVLTRADTVLLMTESKPFIVSFGERALPGWTRTTFTALSDVVATEVQTTSRGRNLLSATACMHADVVLIEQKILEVQDLIQEARNQRDGWRILKLKALIRFLYDRIDVVLTGAVDPTFQDTTWANYNTFDIEPATGWCCAGEGECGVSTVQECSQKQGIFTWNVNQCPLHGCSIPDDVPQMCPFDSDFLPPSMSGYGCDTEAMDARIARLPESAKEARDVLQYERDSLASVQAAAEQYEIQSQSLIQIQKGIDAVIKGKPVPQSSTVPVKRTHIRALGCEVPACIRGDDIACRTMTGAVFTELRGSFRLSVDHLRLLEDFQNLREHEASRRPLSNAIKARPRDVLGQISQEFYGTLFSNFSITQAQNEALLFALGSDPHLIIGNTLRPLRESVQRLARLIHPGIGQVGEGEEQDSIGSLRGFVRDFAYFLRRSCMERPCNERLDRILKIVFQDACFPYTNGEYLTVDEEEACKKATKLEMIQP